MCGNNNGHRHCVSVALYVGTEKAHSSILLRSNEDEKRRAKANKKEEEV